MCLERAEHEARTGYINIMKKRDEKGAETPELQERLCIKERLCFEVRTSSMKIEQNADGGLAIVM